MLNIGVQSWFIFHRLYLNKTTIFIFYTIVCYAQYQGVGYTVVIMSFFIAFLPESGT